MFSDYFDFTSFLLRLMPKDYKTPRIDQLQDSPQAELPYVETEDGTAVPASNLLHSVSVYRKQKPAGLNVNVKNLGKLVKQPEEVDDDSMNNGMNEDRLKEEIRDRINKLQEVSRFHDIFKRIPRLIARRNIFLSNRRKMNKRKGVVKLVKPLLSVSNKMNLKVPMRGSNLSVCYWKRTINIRQLAKKLKG